MVIRTLLGADYLFSQNLVPNPSFEIMSSCPNGINDVDLLDQWFNPTDATPDLYSSCNSSIVSVPQNFIGYTDAYGDSSYIGIVLLNVLNHEQYREYISVKLISNLEIDSTYCVTAYISTSDSTTAYTDGFGFYFSENLINQNNINRLPYVPQVSNQVGILNDKKSWTRISGYVIGGGEEYLTIGNFAHPDDVNWSGTVDGSNSAYIYIDSISVSKCTPPPDTTAESNFINVYPNPNTGDFTISYGIFPMNQGQFTVWDYAGRLVYRTDLTEGKFEKQIYLPQVSSGLYVWRFDINGRKEETGKLVIRSHK